MSVPIILVDTGQPLTLADVATGIGLGLAIAAASVLAVWAFIRWFG